MAETLTQEFEAEVSLSPSSGGVFEVFVNGILIYSKNMTGKFPDEEKLCQQISAL